MGITLIADYIEQDDYSITIISKPLLYREYRYIEHRYIARLL